MFAGVNEMDEEKEDQLSKLAVEWAERSLKDNSLEELSQHVSYQLLGRHVCYGLFSGYGVCTLQWYKPEKSMEFISY